MDIFQSDDCVNPPSYKYTVLSQIFFVISCHESMQVITTTEFYNSFILKLMGANISDNTHQPQCMSNDRELIIWQCWCKWTFNELSWCECCHHADLYITSCAMQVEHDKHALNDHQCIENVWNSRAPHASCTCSHDLRTYKMYQCIMKLFCSGP